VAKLREAPRLAEFSSQVVPAELVFEELLKIEEESADFLEARLFFYSVCIRELPAE
jgi:hypothetical protein